MPYRRSGKYRKVGGMIGPHRRAWVETVLGTFAMIRVPEQLTLDRIAKAREARGFDPNVPDDFEPEPGDEIYLQIPGYGEHYISLALCKCTAKELSDIETVIRTAIEAARPIVERRDANAQEADARGKDIYSRIYRRVPLLVNKEGNGEQHSPGLHEGSEGVSDVV